MTDAEKRFESIFNGNKWGSSETRSGVGSELKQTVIIRNFLSNFIKDNSITTILDAPCGDCNWQMSIEGIEKVDYTGVDIVEKIVIQNKEKISSVNSNANFFVQDISKDTITKAYDLVIVRDCLQHMPIGSAIKTIKNVLASGSLFFMTNFHVCNNSGLGNTGAEHGEYYKINVLTAPFNFPRPITFFNEHPTQAYETKAMGLWGVNALKESLKMI